MAAQELQTRSERGIVGMILKGTTTKDNPLMILSEKDIPTDLSDSDREQIRLALVGNVTTPLRVEVFCLAEDAEDYTEALNYFETSKVNYLCAPTCVQDGQVDAIVTWVKEMRENRKKIKAVLPAKEADNEAIINYTTPELTIGEKTYTAEQACSRIAGLIAGTPSSMSCTYAVLSDAADCTRMKRKELDAEIDSGHFVVFHDGEKVKVGRGINSLKTIKDDQNEQFKKIKIVEAMDMINDNLTKLIEDNYLGKLPNNFDNKCVVLSAVMDYLKTLMTDNVISEYSADIDVQANKEYLESKGINTADMRETEIRKADTDEKLFLIAAIKIFDAIEDVTIKITV